MNEDKRTLIEKFQDKLTNEFYDYQRDLLEKSKDIVFEMSYQTTIKEEIKDLLISVAMFHTPYELKTLNDTNNLINQVYNDWLKWDSPLSSDLQSSTFNSLRKLLNNDEKEYDDR